MVAQSTMLTHGVKLNIWLQDIRLNPQKSKDEKIKEAESIPVKSTNSP